MDCIVHTGCLNNKGYGQVRVAGKLWLAHRLAYTTAYGPIPAGQVVRHRCDNPACINPVHLELGTQKQNMQDAVERRRISRGEERPHAKLTTEQVAQIRKRYKPRCPINGTRALGREFGVAHTVIGDAVRGITWRA